MLDSAHQVRKMWWWTAMLAGFLPSV